MFVVSLFIIAEVRKQPKCWDVLVLDNHGKNRRTCPGMKCRCCVGEVRLKMQHPSCFVSGNLTAGVSDSFCPFSTFPLGRGTDIVHLPWELWSIGTVCVGSHAGLIWDKGCDGLGKAAWMWGSGDTSAVLCLLCPKVSSEKGQNKNSNVVSIFKATRS